MSFMQPEVWQDSFWMIETNAGTETVPCDVCDPDDLASENESDDERSERLTAEFRDYLEGSKVYSAERQTGWLARLQAPGYMDSTDTSSFETEAECWHYLLESYGTQDDSEREDWESEAIQRLIELGETPEAIGIQGRELLTLNLDNVQVRRKGSNYTVPFYDNGSGELYISRNSLGINGIVRADSWEDAYGICEDEFFPDADDTHEQMIAEYGENYTEDAAWQENYGFRNNTGGGSCVLKDGNRWTSSIYSKDLNGDYLDPLTDELFKALELETFIQAKATNN